MYLQINTLSNGFKRNASVRQGCGAEPPMCAKYAAHTGAIAIGAPDEVPAPFFK